MDDKKLLTKIIASPEDGISFALNEYGGIVKAIVKRILYGHQEDIEECIADVFLKLWQNSSQLQKSKIPLKGFLAVTARNTAIDRYRALRKRQELSLQDNLQEDEFLNLLVDANETHEELIALIYTLAPQDQEIFIRKYYLFEPSKEIAKKLNMAEKNVNLRLSRGRDKLKNLLISKGVQYV